MKKWLWVGVLVLGGCASSSGQLGTLVGRVRFVNTGGAPAGDASLFAVPDGIRIIATLPSLGDRDHGFHFHSVGECQRPTFESAGPHFNPTSKQHGRLNPNGPHAGDLPNIDRGRTKVNMTMTGIRLDGVGGLLDADGAALVVHANGDDLKTDPSGNSGARIICGIVEAA
jgi:Cu-Zn family superoxide dismutase